MYVNVRQYTLTQRVCACIGSMCVYQRVCTAKCYVLGRFLCVGEGANTNVHGAIKRHHTYVHASVDNRTHIRQCSSTFVNTACVCVLHGPIRVFPCTCGYIQRLVSFVKRPHLADSCRPQPPWPNANCPDHIKARPNYAQCFTSLPLSLANCSWDLINLF